MARDRDHADDQAARLPAVVGSAAARLRDASLALRRLAVTTSTLLEPVAELNTTDTWSSPWQRRSTARVDAWQQALTAGAGVLVIRSGWYSRVADVLDAATRAVTAGSTGGRVGGPGVVGDPNSAEGSVVAPTVVVPAMPRGWDDPDLALVRALGAGLSDRADPADPPGGDVGGDGPVWFDAGQLGALAGSLRAAGTAAARLAGAVDATEDQALRAAALALTELVASTGDGLGGAVGAAAAVRPPETFRVAGLAATTDVLRLGAHVIAVDGPRLAASLDRRMAHFAAAEDAVRAGGVLIDQRAWFDDAPPPSLGQIRSVAAGLVALIGTEPKALSAGEVREVGRRLAALSPAAREAVISRLRGAPLAVFAAAVTRLRKRLVARTRAELTALTAVPDLLLASAPAAMLDELVRLLPDLEPAAPGAGGQRGGAPGRDGADADRTDAVVRDGISSSDVGQGGVDDCYLAAALVGLARQRPALLADGIRENANGTFTVTLYRDGRAFPVTVTRDLPGLASADGSGDAGGRPARTGMAAYDVNGRPELWAAVYEKAYARAHGGYDSINGGDPGVATSDLTGRPHRTLRPGEVSTGELAARLAAGDVVIVSTGGEAPRVDSGLVRRHAYTVLAVDVTGGRVLLRNPWEHVGGELTAWYRWDDLRPGLVAVSLTPPR
ncbi:C2 family cysteine protease [Pseudofrankia inefficax]|uniref:Peptidase C2 calpain n=1 Tax=Pseudofrankia inefficax (strain DSM 45817 / CECT 9037 / DDB 130130 / EuI1c) TaxID=298654 RepID=E3J3F6_PSEI1|nr:C2 family cysteine protease [Pseudofrankia inefficax]ADP78158.1 peptidase C2 calpain [Pseudofrankia inefficax]